VTDFHSRDNDLQVGAPRHASSKYSAVPGPLIETDSDGLDAGGAPPGRESGGADAWEYAERPPNSLHKTRDLCGAVAGLTGKTSARHKAIPGRRAPRAIGWYRSARGVEIPRPRGLGGGRHSRAKLKRVRGLGVCAQRC